MSNQRKISKLRDSAIVDVGKGKYKKALDKYNQLEMLETDDGDWSRRAGEMYRYLGQNDRAIAALTRASDKYSAVGFLVKSVAVCKMILRLDPSHTETQSRLTAINIERGIRVEAPRPPTAPEVVASPPPAPVPPRRVRTLPPGQPLEVVSLREVVAGAVAVPVYNDPHATSGMFEIPLSENDILDVAVVPDAAESSATLRQTPLFSELSARSLAHLIEQVELVELEPGEVLFKQGQDGSELYVIDEGEVGVIDEGPPRVTVAKLTDGAFFGEIAVVTDQPRTATAEALVPTKLLAIDRSVFSELIENEAAVVTVLLRFLRDRLMENLTRTSSLFEPFSGDDRWALAKKFKFLEVEPGAVLIEQGERSAGLYIMLAGQAEVFRQEMKGLRRLATLGPGSVCGEMSLLSQGDAVATVKATTKSFVLRMPSSDFRELIMTHPQVLAFVGDMAAEKERKFNAIVDGEAEYDAGQLPLV